MTEQEFDEMYERSLQLMDEYIVTQETQRQIFDAKHRKKHVLDNRGFFLHQVKEKSDVYLCSCCGAMATANYMEPTKTEMLASRSCFSCNHWEKIASNPKKGRLIIDGDTYSDGGNQPNPRNNSWLGFSGRKWTIERDGETWETNNLWSGGTIPNEFRDRLVDNARFVKEKKCTN